MPNDPIPTSELESIVRGVASETLSLFRNQIEPKRTVRLDLEIKYLCGCTETVRTEASVPVSLLIRSPENDRKLIAWVAENNSFAGWACRRRHNSGTMTGFDKIIGILN